MCEMCHQHPCDSRCPNADGPRVVYRCEECDENIYEGDFCYKLRDVIYCERCISESGYYADAED